MSSANQNSNLSTPKEQKLTRRRFFSALAAIGALPLVPHIVGLEGVTPQDFNTVEPPITDPEPPTEIPANAETTSVIEAYNKQLTDHFVTLFDFQAKLYGISRLGYQVDTTKLIEKWAAASLAAKAIDDLLISIAFEGDVLKPLCGPDYPRLIAALAHGVEKVKG